MNDNENGSSSDMEIPAAINAAIEGFVNSDEEDDDPKSQKSSTKQYTSTLLHDFNAKSQLIGDKSKKYSSSSSSSDSSSDSSSEDSSSDSSSSSSGSYSSSNSRNSSKQKKSVEKTAVITQPEPIEKPVLPTTSTVAAKKMQHIESLENNKLDPVPPKKPAFSKNRLNSLEYPSERVLYPVPSRSSKKQSKSVHSHSPREKLDPVWRQIDLNRKFNDPKLSGYKSDGGGSIYNTDSHTVCSKKLAARRSGYISDYTLTQSGYKTDCSVNSFKSGYKSDCSFKTTAESNLHRKKVRRKRRSTQKSTSNLTASHSRTNVYENELLSLMGLQINNTNEASVEKSKKEEKRDSCFGGLSTMSFNRTKSSLTPTSNSFNTLTNSFLFNTLKSKPGSSSTHFLGSSSQNGCRKIDNDSNNNSNRNKTNVFGNFFLNCGNLNRQLLDRKIEMTNSKRGVGLFNSFDLGGFSKSYKSYDQIFGTKSISSSPSTPWATNSNSASQQHSTGKSGKPSARCSSIRSRRMSTVSRCSSVRSENSGKSFKVKPLVKNTSKNTEYLLAQVEQLSESLKNCTINSKYYYEDGYHQIKFKKSSKKKKNSCSKGDSPLTILSTASPSTSSSKKRCRKFSGGKTPEEHKLPLKKRLYLMSSDKIQFDGKGSNSSSGKNSLESQRSQEHINYESQKLISPKKRHLAESSSSNIDLVDSIRTVSLDKVSGKKNEVVKKKMKRLEGVVLKISPKSGEKGSKQFVEDPVTEKLVNHNLQKEKPGSSIKNAEKIGKHSKSLDKYERSSEKLVASIKLQEKPEKPLNKLGKLIEKPGKSIEKPGKSMKMLEKLDISVKSSKKSEKLSKVQERSEISSEKSMERPGKPSKSSEKPRITLKSLEKLDLSLKTLEKTDKPLKNTEKTEKIQKISQKTEKVQKNVEKAEKILKISEKPEKVQKQAEKLDKSGKGSEKPEKVTKTSEKPEKITKASEKSTKSLEKQDKVLTKSNKLNSPDQNLIRVPAVGKFLNDPPIAQNLNHRLDLNAKSDPTGIFEPTFDLELAIPEAIISKTTLTEISHIPAAKNAKGNVVDCLLNKTGASMNAKRKRRKQINRTGFPNPKKKKYVKSMSSASPASSSVLDKTPTPEKKSEKVGLPRGRKRKIVDEIPLESRPVKNTRRSHAQKEIVPDSEENSMPLSQEISESLPMPDDKSTKLKVTESRVQNRRKTGDLQSEVARIPQKSTEIGKKTTGIPMKTPGVPEKPSNISGVPEKSSKLPKISTALPELTKKRENFVADKLEKSKKEDKIKAKLENDKIPEKVPKNDLALKIPPKKNGEKEKSSIAALILAKNLKEKSSNQLEKSKLLTKSKEGHEKLKSQEVAKQSLEKLRKFVEPEKTKKFQDKFENSLKKLGSSDDSIKIRSKNSNETQSTTKKHRKSIAQDDKAESDNEPLIMFVKKHKKSMTPIPSKESLKKLDDDSSISSLSTKDSKSKKKSRKVLSEELEKAGIYQQIKQNVYHSSVKPKLRKPIECDCKPDSGCKENCLNRITFSECSLALCPNKLNCTNRVIQKQKFCKFVEKFMTEKKGLGIRTRGKIEKDTFIMEYLGEVITEKMFKERMDTIYANDTHHYCLNIDSGLVIDGHRMGSECRFVNHSCNPNCEMQKIYVHGLPRMILVAKRVIEPMEELTYDYKFSLYNPLEGQDCFCGEETCRGKIIREDKKRPVDYVSSNISFKFYK